MGLNKRACVYACWHRHADSLHDNLSCALCSVHLFICINYVVGKSVKTFVLSYMLQSSVVLVAVHGLSHCVIAHTVINIAVSTRATSPTLLNRSSDKQMNSQATACMRKQSQACVIRNDCDCRGAGDAITF